MPCHCHTIHLSRIQGCNWDNCPVAAILRLEVAVHAGYHGGVVGDVLGRGRGRDLVNIVVLAPLLTK